MSRREAGHGNAVLPEGPRVLIIKEQASCNFCNKAYAHYQVEGKSVAVRLCMTCADDLRKAIR